MRYVIIEHLDSGGEPLALFRFLEDAVEALKLLRRAFPHAYIEETCK